LRLQDFVVGYELQSNSLWRGLNASLSLHFWVRADQDQRGSSAKEYIPTF